jgi:hypothetical protein
MKKYFSTYIKLLSAVFVFHLVSCATITVNVYFPAEEVRQAYTNLEEEFLLEGESGETSPKKDSNATGEPGSRLRFGSEPLIKVTKVVPITQKLDLDIIRIAAAAEDITQKIESEMKKFPEVIQSFKSRASRQSGINSLLDSGKVGEANNGMLVEKGSLSASEKALMQSENKDRNTIIEGMAKAIIKINNIEASSQNIKKVYPEAAEQFATSRRNVAKSGWKVQLPSGQWAVKK